MVNARHHLVSRVLQNLQDAVRVGASDQGLDRVESRNRYVPMGFPEGLVAPPDGTRTTDFAVPLRRNTAEDQTVAAWCHSVKIRVSRAFPASLGAGAQSAAFRPHHLLADKLL